jgi:phosphate transport system permease protein
MSTTDTEPPPSFGLEESLTRGSPGRGDAVFRVLAAGAGSLVLVLILAIAGFLLAQALPAFQKAGLRFLTERAWFPDATPAKFGVAALAFGTLASSLLALTIALPVAVGSALFTTEIAPRAVGRASTAGSDGSRSSTAATAPMAARSSPPPSCWRS